MCIIVYKPRGVSLKKDTYENCFDNNKDGAGYIVREKSGELKLAKGFFTFKEFWDSFVEHQSKQAIVHFRIATHGKIDKENCHPFWVEENKLAFAHNGVVSTSRSSDIKMSDTYHFNVNILQHLKEKVGVSFVEDPVIQELLHAYIGGGSKLAFLSESGKVWIFNKSMGTMEGGVWYSNYSFRRWAYTKSYHDTYSPPVEKEKLKEQVPLVLAPANLPVPSRTGPPLSSIIRQYDYIEMLQPFKDLKGTEVGLVQAVLQHGMIQAKLFDHSYPNGFKIRALPVGVFRKYADSHTHAFNKETD